MKKLAIIAAAFVATTTMSFAALSGSAHDFSDGVGKGNDAWNTSGEICKPCHTPHNAKENNNVIWSHDPSTTPTYQNYTSPTTGAQSGTVSATGTTKLCLSCHDGTTALDSYTGNTTGGTSLVSGDSSFVGQDLRNDHPIGVSLATSNTRDSSGYRATPTNSLPLFGGLVECASCHDVHNTSNQTSLLRVNNAASALCISCHTK